MENFDFIKGFTGVDILSVEAVSKVVGRALAALFEGMIEGGMSEEQAHKVLTDAWREILSSIRKMA